MFYQKRQMSPKFLWHYLQAEAKPHMFVLPRFSEICVFSEESFLFKQYIRIKIQFFFRHNPYFSVALCFSLEHELLIISLVSIFLFSLLHTKTIESTPSTLIPCSDTIIFAIVRFAQRRAVLPLLILPLLESWGVDRDPIGRAPQVRDCNSGRILAAFAKLRKAIVSFVMSVRPHGTTRLRLDGFLLDFIFENVYRKFELC